MHNKSILLVDDEEIIRHSIGRDLIEENYTKTFCPSACTVRASEMIQERIMEKENGG